MLITIKCTHLRTLDNTVLLNPVSFSSICFYVLLTLKCYGILILNKNQRFGDPINQNQ